MRAKNTARPSRAQSSIPSSRSLSGTGRENGGENKNLRVPSEGPLTLRDRVRYLENKAREIRRHVIDMVYTTQSGHIGGSLSLADIMAALYFDVLRVDPRSPRRVDRDRFVLSKGHACPVLYTCLAMRGYFPLETLQTLRQFGSILQGHPVRKTPGIDVATGSLGFGFSQAVGLALDARLSSSDHRVFCVVGNGEIQEGIVWEAAAAAARFKLDNLILIVDDNHMQNDGFTQDIMPMAPIDAKFKAFNWHVAQIDGHDMRQIVTTFDTYCQKKGKCRNTSSKPFCIITRTIKGKGVGLMENQRRFHGKPPTQSEYEIAMRELGQSS